MTTTAAAPPAPPKNLETSTENCNLSSETPVKNDQFNSLPHSLVNKSSNQEVATTPVADSVSKVALNECGEVAAEMQPKRLHVSNIPFRFRDPDLRAMFGVSGFSLLATCSW